MTQKQFTQELVLHFLKADRQFDPNNHGIGDLNHTERKRLEELVSRADDIARYLYVRTNGFFDPEKTT